MNLILMLQPFVGVLECKAHFPGDSLSIVEEDILFLLPASCPPSCAQHAAYPPRHRSAWSLPPHTAQSQRRSSRSRLSSRALGAGAALREDQWAGRAARQGPGMTACSTGRERGRQSQLGTPSTEAPASPKRAWAASGCNSNGALQSRVVLAAAAHRVQYGAEQQSKTAQLPGCDARAAQCTRDLLLVL